jgi:hypothetical protein
MTGSHSRESFIEWPGFKRVRAWFYNPFALKQRKTGLRFGHRNRRQSIPSAMASGACANTSRRLGVYSPLKGGVIVALFIAFLTSSLTPEQGYRVSGLLCD